MGQETQTHHRHRPMAMARSAGNIPAALRVWRQATNVALAA
jgi:hypothetical protein